MTESTTNLNRSETALFEDSYFRRSLGAVVSQPDVALTELVANAWGAGATTVKIAIPEKVGGKLLVVDDGAGMTAAEFDRRWRTLRYNRTAHQGHNVEFPPGVERRTRLAYGRNGFGRHAMLCFADSYQVATAKAGVRTFFLVSETAGDAPFRIETLKEESSSRHGTRLECSLTKGIPDVEEVRQVLSARFLYDPEFTVVVNGAAVELEDHSGLVTVDEFDFADGLTAKLFVVDAAESARTKFQHGIAFWVSRRLVGRPSWTIGDEHLLDGRTKEAQRLTFIVEANGLHDQVKADWSGFVPSRVVTDLLERSAAVARETMRQMMSERVESKVEAMIHAHREQVRDLQPLARLEVAEFAHDVVRSHPLVPDEVLSAAVDALVRLEDSRSGQELIRKLAKFEPDDVVGLNRLLEEWTIRDALAVLDEVGKRIRVVEAIEKLALAPDANELHTLHPLVAQTRWLFGSQFYSPRFISNVALRTAISRITGGRGSGEQFENPRKRPDLLFLQESTLSATAVDGWDEATGLARLDQILLLELRKGDSTIGRAEMRQAEEYVEELMHAGESAGKPKIRAFVVGTRVEERRSSGRTLKDGEVDRGFIEACTFHQLVRTANKRLFLLRDAVEPALPGGADATIIHNALLQQRLI